MAHHKLKHYYPAAVDMKGMAHELYAVLAQTGVSATEIHHIAVALRQMAREWVGDDGNGGNGGSGNGNGGSDTEDPQEEAGGGGDCCGATCYTVNPCKTR